MTIAKTGRREMQKSKYRVYLGGSGDSMEHEEAYWIRTQRDKTHYQYTCTNCHKKTGITNTRSVLIAVSKW